VACTPIFWSLPTFAFLNYAAIKYRFRGPVASQPASPWQPVCAPLVGGGLVHMTISSYEVDKPTSNELWCILSVNIVPVRP